MRKRNGAAPTEKDVKFDEEYDVIVIGTGFSGLAAAAKAAERGYKVLILEKMGRVGGNSVINGGGMAVPMNKYQKEHGIVDSGELFIKDCLQRGSWFNHVEMWKRLLSALMMLLNLLLNVVPNFKMLNPAWVCGHSVARTLVHRTTMSGSGSFQPMAAL